MSANISKLKLAIQPAREQLLSHKVYSQINDLQGLQKFASFHVFAVWDFMSLLKSLQIGLTSVSLPWLPVGSANTRYLINEIVTGEESDVDEQGKRMSHFELYKQAMEQMGASSEAIDTLIIALYEGQNIFTAIELANIPTNIKSFLAFTFDIAINASPAGMKPEDKLPINMMNINSKMLVGCVITAPSVTKLIEIAKSKGCKTTTGADMFAEVRQLMIDFLLGTENL